MPANWEARERKVSKRKNGMRRSGDSVFVVRDAQKKRDKKLIDKEWKNGNDYQN